VPVSLITTLGLIQWSSTSAVLADGSRKLLEVFAADLEWENNLREVLVSALGDEPLIGMALLENCRLEVEVRPGGAVAITARP
jgi:predicted aspartyl protease